MMAEFPLDPQLAKMLVTSPDFRCLGGRGDAVDNTHCIVLHLLVFCAFSRAPHHPSKLNFASELQVLQ